MRFGLIVGGVAVAVLAVSSLVGCGHVDPSSPANAKNEKNSSTTTVDLGGEANESMLVNAAQIHVDRSCDGAIAPEPSTSALYGKACKAGDGESCAKLGMLYMCGAGFEKNGTLAMSMFERSCNLKHPNGCQLQAGNLIAGSLTKRDVQRGIHIYQNACDGGSAQACGSLGSILMIMSSSSTTDASNANANRAIALLERSCTLGNEDACANFAVVELNGTANRPKNVAHAVSIAKASCAKQNPFSCSVLGSLHMSGTGVEKDEASAAKLFTFACNGNDALGCMFLGVCTAQGIGVSQDLQVAATSLKKGCDGGNGQACRFLAEMSGVPGVPSASMPSSPTSSAAGGTNPTMF